MLAPEMTLAAALRDADESAIGVRIAGVRNLALALLAELGRPAPAWRADDDHGEGGRVRARLLAALDDASSDVRGHAAIGLGLLGRAEVIERAVAWFEIAGDDDASQWLRQAAAIAVAHVGSAAPSDDPIRTTIAAHLRAAFASTHPDLRFQAALGLVEVCDAAAEPILVDALADEDEPEVRAQIVAALAHLPALRATSCDALARLVGDPGPIGFEAALALVANGRTEGGPRLVAAVDAQDERDRALEALAVLGPAAPSAALEPVARLARSWRAPAVTRVRAAYAWRRIARDEAEAHRADRRLAALGWHPRAMVRAAVADARRALAELAARPDLGA